MGKHYFKYYALIKDSSIVLLFYCFEEPWTILLDAPSCGLRREAKSFFPFLLKLYILN